jgi:hypothetical protein
LKNEVTGAYLGRILIHEGKVVSKGLLEGITVMMR